LRSSSAERMGKLALELSRGGIVFVVFVYRFDQLWRDRRGFVRLPIPPTPIRYHRYGTPRFPDRRSECRIAERPTLAQRSAHH
jgi:hypothetical protein